MENLIIYWNASLSRIMFKSLVETRMAIKLLKCNQINLNVVCRDVERNKRSYICLHQIQNRNEDRDQSLLFLLMRTSLALVYAVVEERLRRCDCRLPIQGSLPNSRIMTC
mmetsp:Transcript_2426/g.3727  ORF Transcript_2426/g.3727 Transcript_2426/m.3727 type:complete len:110 (-) Transcript_2426:71-400(-)